MAKRESQGMQIALILLVIATVVLCIATYFFWSQGQKAQKQADSANERLQQSERSLRDAVAENVKLKTFIGFGDEGSSVQLDPNNEIDQSYANDMSLYGQSVPEGDRNYKNLPAHLAATLKDKNIQINELKASEAKLKAELANAEKTATGKVTTATDGHKKADMDLQSQREEFETQIAQLTNTVDQIKKKFDATNRRLNGEKNDLQKQLASTTSDLEILRQRHEDTEDKLRRLQVKTFEQPDGMITHVNQSSGTVYLNIGRNDALQRQTTFSVYDVDENNLARAQPKGSIEVTKIIGDHLAEARVLEDSVTDPIISGDAIYSPLWQAGRPVHFALAGRLDANGDGSDDSELIRNLISINGGAVDAIVDKDGVRTGELSIETRYLVVGKSPSRRDEKAVAEYKRLRNEAESFGVLTLSLDRFLADMGYQAVGRVVALGTGASDSDFRSERQAPKIERFRPRTPRTRKTPSLEE